jgi:hypothetical protein
MAAARQSDETVDPINDQRLPDDAALAARAEHERESFVLLYRRYVGPVYASRYHRLGYREAAEDATSRTFPTAIA